MGDQAAAIERIRSMARSAGEAQTKTDSFDKLLKGRKRLAQ